LSAKTRPIPAFPQPLDRVAISIIVVLLLIIGVVLGLGDRTAPHVRDFSWQDKQIGSEDTAFVLSFSRPMNHESVKNNLKITPPLPGKISWAGRRMAYTLDMPAPYGRQHQIQLQEARDFFSQGESEPALITPFKAEFQTRDRAFAYIGVQGDEAGRLILCNLTRKDCVPITPPNLVVNDFKPYPLGDRILLAATERTNQAQGLLEQKLYRVSTGIQVNPPIQVDTQSEQAPTATSAQPLGTLEQILDSTAYQTLKFDLSANGKVIVVQRVSRSDPADFGPWILREGKEPEPLRGQPGGDFLITPDSDSLAIAQGQGLAILPLQPDAQPLDFLPKFGVVLNFSRDGSLAAMVKFNTDQTRSLFLVTNQGTTKELLKITGSIFAAQFDPKKQVLYCLLSELIPGDTYQEKPYLAAIDLKTNKLTPLISMPNQRDVQFSLAPDGLGVLYDQTAQGNSPAETGVRDRGGKAIANSKLWLLPTNSADFSATPQPEELPMQGLRPQWLP
jgi:hypothetical protein